MGEDAPVTYCISMRVDGGLVFLSDTRTNAGVDNVSTYRKLHVFRPGPDRLFVIQSAGNLATTQQVLDRIEQDLTAAEPTGLATVGHLFEASLYVGALSVEVLDQHRGALSQIGADATATFLVGGQVGDEAPDIHLVYPQGNYIRASDELPYLQIGEAKYGKPILDRIIRPETEHETAMRCALVSMDSTMRSNATVGPPIELLFYRADSLSEPAQYCKFEENDDYLVGLRRAWDDNIREAFAELPSLQAVFDQNAAARKAR